MKYLKTNPKQNNAGIGHQFTNWQVGAALAKKWGYGFVHTPLISPRSGGDWDSFLGLGEGYPKKVEGADTVKLPNKDLGHGAGVERGRQNIEAIHEFVENGPDNTVYQFPHNKFSGIVSKDVSLIVPEMREKYRKRNLVDRSDSEFRVSFHLRRGDVDPHVNTNRWVSDEFYISWMERIKNYLEPRVENLSVYLLSTTGDYTKSFDNYPDFVNRRIDCNPFDDFKFMADSDVLFCGLSNYSALAAIYNVGFTFYIPFDVLHYCAWMEDGRNPRSEMYCSAKSDEYHKFENWING